MSLNCLKKNSCEGFTLFELLISSVLLAIIVGLLLNLSDQTSRIWHSGEQQRQASREIRAGLVMMADDLHSAVITTNPNSFMIMNEAANNGQQLFFLVSHPHEMGKRKDGDLCATGYFIAEDPHQKGAQNLYRLHISGEVVAKAFQQNSLQALYTSASPNNTATTELLARNLVRLNVHTIEKNASIGDLVLLSLSAPTKGHTQNRNQSSSEKDLSRLSVIVRLPSKREHFSGL